MFDKCTFQGLLNTTGATTFDQIFLFIKILFCYPNISLCARPCSGSRCKLVKAYLHITFSPEDSKHTNSFKPGQSQNNTDR